MYNSIFLKGKNKGINKELRGKVAFCYILVDEQAGRWSEDDEHAVVNTIRQTSSWLMQEAGKKIDRYGESISSGNNAYHGSRMVCSSE